MMTDRVTTTDKAALAVAAGAGVFMRHGYAKTTMATIAEAAGMSRPALYLLFGNKDEVLKAVIDEWADRSLIAMESAIADLPTLADKLRAICRMWTLEAFERSQTIPEVRDLAGRPAYAAGYARFVDYVALVLKREGKDQAGSLSADRLAAHLVNALRGFKLGAGSTEQMLDLIDTQVALTVATYPTA